MRIKFLFLFSAAILLWTARDAYCTGYIVDTGDVLQISVYGHPDLGSEIRVGEEGNINFPLIGEVTVEGMSVSRITDVITAKLADGFIIDPQVSITMVKFRMLKVSIMGKVINPGLYELQGSATFLELLSKAGGLSPGHGSRATIKRKTSSPQEVGLLLEVDLEKLIKQGMTYLDVALKDGDGVHVGEAESFYVSGEVRNPGVFKLRGETSLIQAITLAGGFTDRAAPKGIIVTREVSGKKEILVIGEGAGSMDMAILMGDLINVPKAGLYYVTGEVKKPGAYAFEPETTVMKAVTVAGGLTDKGAKKRIRIIRSIDGVEKVLKKVGLDRIVQPGDVIEVPESFF